MLREILIGITLLMLLSLSVNALCANPLELFCIFADAPTCTEKQTIEEIKVPSDIERVRNFAVLCPLNVTSKFINNVTQTNTTFIQTIQYQCDVISIPYISRELISQKNYINETVCT